MAGFSGTVRFGYSGGLSDVARAFSDLYCAGMPFIPKDRRTTRDFDEALYCEYDLLGFQIEFCRDAGSPLRLHIGSSEVWPEQWRPEELSEVPYASAERWLAALLRAIPGPTPTINLPTAGERVAAITSHSFLNSRWTFEEEQAMFTQRLCPGLRFVPDPGLPGATVLERDLLGHRIELRRPPGGSSTLLSIVPSPTALALLTEAERSDLEAVDLTLHIRAVLRSHGWLSGGLAITPEEFEALCRSSEEDEPAAEIE